VCFVCAVPSVMVVSVAWFRGWELPPLMLFMAVLPGFGLSVIADRLLAGQIWLRLIGGLFLCYLAYNLLRQAGTGAKTPESADLGIEPRHDLADVQPEAETQHTRQHDQNAIAGDPNLAIDRNGNVKHNHIFIDYFSTFGLTLTNPITILAFVAIFAGLGVHDRAQAIVSVLGVFLGSAVWWLFLTIFVGYFRRRLTQQGMILINRIGGVTIAIFGILSLISIFQNNY
jgi:threonine/homoserine/homoserine lactone efflux protein